MRILLSAYACEPGRGSEPGVGWRWALEMAQLGHEVWVLTRSNNRARIAAARVPPNLQFLYCDVPRWAGWWKRGGRGVHLYYALWQWLALRRARRAHARIGFDVAQHLTFGVMRQASRLGALGIPFVVGPVGGAERAPWALRRHYSWRAWCVDALRDAANCAARWAPGVRGMFAAATLVLAKTPATLAWLPHTVRARALCACQLEIGIDPPRLPARGTPAERKPLRLVYVGRFLALKGMGLGLRALGVLARAGVAFELTLIGQGPEAACWRAIAKEEGIAGRVTWIPWMSQASLFHAYQEFDAMLFPSLRDTSGNVVLEALARGLPVVCLDLGGPACMVTARCGVVVPAAGRPEATVVEGLAMALRGLAVDPLRRAKLSAGARARAGAFTWAAQVARVWGPEGLAVRVLAGAAMRATPAGRVPESRAHESCTQERRCPADAATVATIEPVPGTGREPCGS